MARPSKYHDKVCEQATKLCRLGATDKQVADFFEIAESTLHKWKLDYPEFSEALKTGKLLSDSEVANSLYRRALGYSHDAVKIMTLAGAIEKVAYTEHYPPDTTACIFWLKNRQPQLWREKREDVDPEDVDVSPVTVTIAVADASKR